MINHDQIIEELFKRCGPATLADQLGISRQAVYQWRQVPATRARAIEKLTGMSREELRPDIYGEA